MYLDDTTQGIDLATNQWFEIGALITLARSRCVVSDHCTYLVTAPGHTQANLY